MLDPRLTQLMEKSERDGGIWLKDLIFGDVVKVQTENTLYTIRVGVDGRYTIQGHDFYCPAPTACNINGSTWGGSMLKMGFIGVGMRLEFVASTVQDKLQPRLITTSDIEMVSINRQYH